MALTKVYANGTIVVIDEAGKDNEYFNKAWTRISRFEDDKVYLTDAAGDEAVEILFTDFYAEDGTTNYPDEASIVTYLGVNCRNR